MEYPLWLSGRVAGQLEVTAAGEDTLFRCGCPGLPPGLWRVLARGERASLPLGLLTEGRLSRRFSRRLTEPLGPLRGGVLESVLQESSPWRPARAEDCPLPLPPGSLCQRAGTRRRLALPYEPGAPFPLPELFCLARVCSMERRRWVLLCFEGDVPVTENKI